MATDDVREEGASDGLRALIRDRGELGVAAETVNHDEQVAISVLCGCKPGKNVHTHSDEGSFWYVVSECGRWGDSVSLVEGADLAAFDMFDNSFGNSGEIIARASQMQSFENTLMSRSVRLVEKLEYCRNKDFGDDQLVVRTTLFGSAQFLRS